MRHTLIALTLLTVICTAPSVFTQDDLPDRVESTVSRPRLVSQLGHADALNQVAFSPDGRYILTRSQNGSARLWHAETGLELHTFGQGTFIGGDPGLFGVFSPSGKTVAAGHLAGGNVHLLDIATGRELRTFSGHRDMVGAVAFSSDGQYLLTGSHDGSAILWDIDQASPLHVYSGGFDPNKFVGFSSDKRYVVTAGSAFQGAIADNDMLVIWSRAGEELFRFVWHGTILQDVAISEVAPLLATATRDGKVTLLSLESGQAVGGFRNPGVTSVAFLQDGRHMVTVNRQSGTLWSLSTGRAVRRLEARGHGPTVVAASRDGRYVLTGGEDRTARIWSVDLGHELMRLEGKATSIEALVFSSDGRTLYTASPLQSIVAWSLEAGTATGIFHGQADSAAVALSLDGKYAALARAGRATVISLETGKEIQHIRGPFERHMSIEFSPDGKALTAVDHGQLSPQGDYAPRFRKWSVANGRELQAVHLQKAHFSGVVYSPNGHHMAMAYVTMRMSGPPPDASRTNEFTFDLGAVDSGLEFQSKLVLVDLQTKRQLELKGDFTESLAFSPDGLLLATGHLDGIVRVWSVRDGREVLQLRGHPDTVNAVAFSPTAPYLATGSADLTRLWDMEKGREIARLLSSAPDAWTVVDLSGRFDSYDLEAVEGLHWVMPDDPLTPLPLEIFMRDYYEPRLLPRLLTGEPLPPIRNLSQLNRVQPRVEITQIDPVPGHPDQVRITVEVESQSRTFTRSGRNTSIASGVYDLHLFRDGRLVAQWPAPADQPSGQLTVTTPEALQAWQDASAVTRDGRATKTFTIRLPRRTSLDAVEFTAYAFNADRVKSTTTRKTYQVPAGLAPVQGRAYVISVGVTTTQDPYWRLDFAGADARLLRDQLTAALHRSEAYAGVVPVTLVNRRVGPFAETGDETSVQPTKANIQTVLGLLAGQDVAPAQRDQIPEPVRSRLQRAAPQDLVVLSIAAHGVRDAEGLFYVLPYDIGSGSEGRVTEMLKQRAISSEELSLWLRGIDAQMVMVLATCYSASAVEAGGFKPGPLGNRGLGQLSYDKGMPVLVSSQSSSWEVGGYGLLMHALAMEGLGEALQQSGRMTLTDVLMYATARVPALYAERIGGMEAVQKPMLFDYRQKKLEIVLIGKR